MGMEVAYRTVESVRKREITDLCENLALSWVQSLPGSALSTALQPSTQGWSDLLCEPVSRLEMQVSSVVGTSGHSAPALSASAPGGFVMAIGTPVRLSVSQLIKSAHFTLGWVCNLLNGDYVLDCAMTPTSVVFSKPFSQGAVCWGLEGGSAGPRSPGTMELLARLG